MSKHEQEQQAFNFQPTEAVLRAVKVIDPELKAQVMIKYGKLKNQLKGYLKGKGYHTALAAFDEGEKTHIGVRKDGVTPEFQHQIEICLFIITLKEVKDEENTLIAALLHDIREDYHLEHSYIEGKFGKIAADAIEKLTKEFKGIKKDTQDYFNKIAECPIASLVKIADRINNISSMVGVFSIKKQEDYLFEIKEYFLPMIKVVRNRFPEQSLSYYGMNTFLKNMSHTIQAVLKAENLLIKNNVVSEPIKPRM